MTVREQTEINEIAILSRYACTSVDEENTRRVRYEEKCPYRTEGQRPYPSLQFLPKTQT